MILNHLMSNPFFNNTGPYRIDFLLEKIDLKIINKDINVTDIKDLFTASNGNITFFQDLKYKDDLLKTKASVCILKKEHKELAPKNLILIYSENPYMDFTKISQKS